MRNDDTQPMTAIALYERGLITLQEAVAEGAPLRELFESVLAGSEASIKSYEARVADYEKTAAKARDTGRYEVALAYDSNVEYYKQQTASARRMRDKVSALLASPLDDLDRDAVASMLSQL